MSVDKLSVNPAEAAEMISCPVRTVWEEIAAGRLKSFKLGRRRLIRVAELAAYLERRELLDSPTAAIVRRPVKTVSGGPLPFPELGSGGTTLVAASSAATQINRAANRKARTQLQPSAGQGDHQK